MEEDYLAILYKTDPEISFLIEKELERQEKKIELIASENFVDEHIMEAMGSVLTNKYAEGYPGRRYYGGCEFVDKIEEIAIQRAKKLFGAEHANVQPHSGSQANMAVYFAFLKPNDLVLGMDLSHGGHLTHGNPINFSGSLYSFVSYGVDKNTHLIDYDQILEIAKKYKPRLIVAGASSYPREINFKYFREIADKVSAYLMVDMAHIAGLVAAGYHMNPLPYADVVTSTTHKTLKGPRGGFILCKKEHALAIDKAVFPGIQGGPLMHVIAAKAVAFGQAFTKAFKDYSKLIITNAKSLAEFLLLEGFDLVSKGTDTHLLLIDLQNLKLTGKEAENLLDKVGITVNKNVIPFDPKSPFVTSGIRLGTAAVSARGMGRDAMQKIAKFISLILKNPDDENIRNRVMKGVEELVSHYPLYKNKGV